MQLAKRTQPVDNGKPAEPASASSSIFGGAKPVDTAAKEREIEEKLLQEQRKEAEKKAANRSRTTSERSSDDPEQHQKTIFGHAKPVDTSRREREIEEKLRKTEIVESSADSRHKEGGKPKLDESSNNNAERKVRSPPVPKKVEEEEPPVSTKLRMLHLKTDQ